MKTLRFAVVGAGRGKSFVHTAQSMPGEVDLVAVCDLDELSLADWKSQGLRTYLDYNLLLADPEVDAVCLATPVPLHARQAIAALNAGKHVLSEVPAAYTLDDCWDLIGAVERSGKTYMLAENYCFMRDVMMVGEMVRKGVFGDLIHAEGSYIHDCRDLFFKPDGKLTWRGELHREYRCNTYPTHSLGPVCKWLGVNQGDRLKSMAAWGSPSLSAAHYVKRNMGPEHELAAADQWRLPNSVSTILNTVNGVLIEHRLDWASPRPHHMARYGLQGTRAAFASNVDPALEPLIWIEDRSETTPSGVAGNWEPLWKYSAEFEHPLWRDSGAEAEKAGHGGGDFFVLREFVAAVREQRPPIIDVYDAVTWSSITPLSAISLESNGAPVDVPDFTQAQSLEGADTGVVEPLPQK